MLLRALHKVLSLDSTDFINPRLMPAPFKFGREPYLNDMKRLIQGNNAASQS